MGGFKRWLQRVGNNVSNFFQSVWDQVEDWWEDGIDWVTDNVPQIIEVAEKLKKFFKGPVDNMVLSKWLGLKWYGEAEKIIKEGLRRTIATLKDIRDVNACLDEDMTDAEQVDCLADELRGMIQAGDEGKWVFEWAKNALTYILENKGIKVPDNAKVERMIQTFYDAKKLDK